MDKKILKNYFYNVLYQVVLIALPFFTTAYLSRALGLQAIGINSIVTNRVQWFTIFGILGVNMYGNREIAKVRDDKKVLSRTFFEIFAMQAMTMALAAIAYAISLQFESSYVLLSSYQLIAMVGAALDITWFFYGVEDFKKASLRNIFIKILGVSLMFLFVKNPSDLALFILINIAVNLLGQLIMWLQLKEYISLSKISFSAVLKHLKPNLILFAPQLAINVYQLLNVKMLEHFSIPEQVALYQQSQNFVKMFLFLITSIGSVVLARVANLSVKEDEKALQPLLRTVMELALFLAIPMMAGICALVPFFIPWFLPADFQPVTGLILLSSPIILFISLSNVYGIQYLVPLGKMKQYTLSVVMGAVVNFVLNLFLLSSHQALGAVIATVAAEFAVILCQWLTVHKQIKLQPPIAEIAKYVFSSIVMAAVVYGLGVLLKADGTKWVNLFKNAVQALGGVAVYGLLLWLLKSQLLLQVIAKLKRRGEGV
ncbi:MAG: polysaccharide biosynthesis C-terminal domain-containing protein [Erysipelotrichaceae bacterium]|jgi:O-antigen/teichoic acid export membrane protein|nr:polysaccharide biosynthesis C-terminal domain-containing protein [Erysipelotrichaceae bacterium]